MEELECMGEHQKHICSLAEKHQIEAITPLTMEPQYICVNCGRVAHSNENLCNPANVDSITLM